VNLEKPLTQFLPRPSFHSVVYYATVGALAAGAVIELPVAGLLVLGHAIATREPDLAEALDDCA
jgi:hypothetical protein